MTLFSEIVPNVPLLGLETIEYDKELKSGSVETSVISVDVLTVVDAETLDDTGASATSLTVTVNCFSKLLLPSLVFILINMNLLTQNLILSMML